MPPPERLFIVQNSARLYVGLGWGAEMRAGFVWPVSQPDYSPTPALEIVCVGYKNNNQTR